MKKPGRPRKSRSDLRSLPVTARFIPSEANQLDLFAKEAGISASECIRTRALTNRPAPSISAALRNDIYRLLLDIRMNEPRDALEAGLRSVLERLQG